MNRIEKFLKKLTKKEQDVFMLLFLQLEKDYKKIPGIKNLSGKNSFWRVRVGKYRLIFKVESGKCKEIIKITKRDENTYKNF